MGGPSLRALSVARKLPRWCRYAWPHARRALVEPRYAVVLAQAGLALWRQGGWREIELAIATSRPAINDYGAWVRMYDTLTRVDRRALRQRIQAMARRPSVAFLLPMPAVPLGDGYEATLAATRATLRSLTRGPYPNWSLWVVAPAAAEAAAAARRDLGRGGTDGRVQVVPAPGGVAAGLNAAAAAAGSDLVCVVGAGDILAEEAPFRLAAELEAFPDTAAVYSDEDRLDARGRRTAPCFKPDWSPDYFLARGGPGTLIAVSSRAIAGGGGFRPGLGNARAFDLLLRVAEAFGPASIRHVPEILVHRPAVAAADGDHVRVAREHLTRTGADAHAVPGQAGMVRVQWRLPEPPPEVTLVIPTRNRADLLRQCVASLVRSTDYPTLEVVLVDNDSDDPAAIRELAALARRPDVRIVRQPGPFNFAALANAGVEAAAGDLVGLINNDLEVIDPGWLRELAALASRPQVGAAGACLWYPDLTLQHGGIIVGLGGVAGHSHKHLPRGEAGHCSRLLVPQEVSAVTAACMVMRRSLYVELGGMDAEALGVAFNDVDLCLRLNAAGYRVLWTPYAQLIHHESATRGPEDTLEKAARFEGEIAVMRARWGDRLARDPYYNPNLTLDREDFSLAWPPRVARAWHPNWPGESCGAG